MTLARCCWVVLLLAFAQCTAQLPGGASSEGGAGSAHAIDDAAVPVAPDAAQDSDAAERDAASVTRDAGQDAALPERDAGGAETDASSPTADAGAHDAGACDASVEPTGDQLDVHSGDTLAAALQNAQPGDRIVMHAGTYPQESIDDCAFAGAVYVEGAAGEAPPVLQGLELHACSHITLRGLRFDRRLLLEGASFITLREVTLDPGTDTEDASLQIHGQGSAGACHDIEVLDSTLANGGRTVFVLGRFAPSEQWNHHLRFANDDFTCGSHNCFQLSGARDTVIEHSRLHSTASSGVLTAGATRIDIRQNRFTGESAASSAVQIASPGMEWDNYDGVENMISSAITVANNLITGWNTGVQLDAARDVAIVFNTIPHGTALRLNHRTPHDRAGNVILEGNSEIKVWNDILAAISIASGETRPSFESNNLVIGAGGGGAALLTGDPGFADTAEYELGAGSPAAGAGLSNGDTPAVDLDGRTRGDPPDLGARERDGTAPPSCP